MSREAKISVATLGFGSFVWVMGGPVAGLCAGVAALIMAQKKFPALNEPWTSLEYLLKQNENEKLEFKQFAYENKRLSRRLVEAIAGFLNAEGGELIVGVADSGKIVGIDQEINEAGGKDKLQLSLRSFFKESLSLNIDRLYRMRFEEKENKTVLRIQVLHSSKKVFAFQEGLYFRRNGNQTKKLSAKDYHEMQENGE